MPRDIGRLKLIYEASPIFTSNTMAFLPTLQEIHDTHIRDANWRCIEAVEDILKMAVMPVEKMRETLITAAKRGECMNARAHFRVDLHSLLLATIPMTMYVTDTLRKGPLRKLVLDKQGVAKDDCLVRRLFRTDGIFTGIKRIQKELVDAFPDGTIAMDVETEFDGNVSLFLEFSVSYTLKTPEDVPKIQ